MFLCKTSVLLKPSIFINSILQLVRNGLGISIVPASIHRNHAYPELSFLDLGQDYTTDVLIATPKSDSSEITKAAIGYLLQ